LSLFRIKTEEELGHLDKLGVPIVTDTIKAYRQIVASPQFLEFERIRSDARHNEAAALRNEREKTENRLNLVIADRDAAIAKKDAELADTENRLNVVIAGRDTAIAKKDAELADKDAELADKDAELADKDAVIARLQSLLDVKK
jgi:septal ring factor EnvC (AmiA/AmiB activator)